VVLALHLDNHFDYPGVDVDGRVFVLQLVFVIIRPIIADELTEAFSAAIAYFKKEGRTTSSLTGGTGVVQAATATMGGVV
jgi:hypothetical protein